MSRDTFETLGFIAALVVWAVLAAVIFGACGGGQRRNCAERRGGMDSNPCQEEGR